MKNYTLKDINKACIENQSHLMGTICIPCIGCEMENICNIIRNNLPSNWVIENKEKEGN